MEKLFLLKKISIIHAIKCNKTTLFEVAVQSSDNLSSLKFQVLNSEFSQLNSMLLISSKKVVVINNFGIAINRFISVSLNSC
jgi:hypothetical protein